MAAKKMANDRNIAQYGNGITGIGGIRIKICQAGTVRDPKVVCLIGESGLIKGLPIRDDDVGVGNTNHDDNSANDWNFRMMPAPVANLHDTLADGVFSRT